MMMTTEGKGVGVGVLVGRIKYRERLSPFARDGMSKDAHGDQGLIVDSLPKEGPVVGCGSCSTRRPGSDDTPYKLDRLALLIHLIEMLMSE